MCICNGYAMGTSGMPDVFTQSLRATGLRTEGVYIRQTTSAHGITNIYHFFAWASTKQLQPPSLLLKGPHYIYTSTYYT